MHFCKQQKKQNKKHVLAPQKIEGLFFALSVTTLHNINYVTIKTMPGTAIFSLTFFRNIKKYLTKSFTILMKFEFFN